MCRADGSAQMAGYGRGEARLRLRLEQSLDRAEMASVGRHDEGRDPVVAAWVDVGVVRQQHAHDRVARVVRGHQQRRRAVLELGLRRSAAREHLFDNRLVAVRGGEEEAAVGPHGASDEHHLVVGQPLVDVEVVQLWAGAGLQGAGDREGRRVIELDRPLEPPRRAALDHLGTTHEEPPQPRQHAHHAAEAGQPVRVCILHLDAEK